MKTGKLLCGILPVLLQITPVLAQKAVPASRIIDQINQGQAVEVRNAVITGVLDLTEIDTKKQVKKGTSSQETYKSKVNVPLSFHNTSFKDDVIAYKVLGNANSQTLYTADFSRQVVFEQCTFEGKSEFKYSDFAEAASFAGSRFSEEANFKYAKFHEGTRFPEAGFSETAHFKYARFDENADFSGAIFSSYADFKYAVFRKQANFSSGEIFNDGDFKYTTFTGDVNFEHTQFKGFANFKYTKFKTGADFGQTSFAKGNDFKYTSGKYTL